MLTVMWHTLRESVHRRMGVVLIVISLLPPGFLLWKMQVRTLPSGLIAASVGKNTELLATTFAQDWLTAQLVMIANVWMLIGIFAVAPLLTSFLEKGWAEMLLAKGVRRWQLFLGRYFGSLLLFAASLAVVGGIPAAYIWWRTGIHEGRFLGALGILLFSFATIQALMALAALNQPTAAVPTMAGFLLTILSPTLALRKETLFRLITSEWARFSMDWLYRILPKNQELGRMATAYWRTGTIDAWWPVWTSAVFLVCTLALALWLFHRKSF